MDNVSSTVTAIVNGLGSLADKLAVPASQVMGWAMQNNYAYAWTDLIFGIVALLLIILALIIGFKIDKTVDKFDKGFPIAGMGFVAMFLLFVAWNYLSGAIHRFIAPQYQSLQDIVQMIQNKD